MQKKPGKRDLLRGQLKGGGGEANGWLGRGAPVEKGTQSLSTGIVSKRITGTVVTKGHRLRVICRTGSTRNGLTSGWLPEEAGQKKEEAVMMQYPYSTGAQRGNNYHTRSAQHLFNKLNRT